MSFCQYCGQQNPDSSKFCFSCGKPLGMVEPANQPQTPPQNNIPVSEDVDATVGANTPYNEPVFETPAPAQTDAPYNEPVFEAPAPMQMNMPYNEPSYQPVYGEQMNAPYNTNGAEAVKPKKNKTPIIAACAILAILLVAAAALIFTHTICIMHEYSDATCEAAAVCKYCGKEDQAALGHSWKDATCEAAKTCDRCALTEGEALGHVWQGGTCTVPESCSRCGATGDAPGHKEGAWQTETEATIVYEGTEVLFCTECNTLIDSKTISKKDPAVSGATFNFTEDEFLEWLDDELGYTIDYSAEYYDGWGYGYYINTPGNSNYGLLFIESGDNGNVDVIGICLDDNDYALANAITIAAYIDPLFSTDAAVTSTVKNGYYTDAMMAILYDEAEDGIYMAALTTYEWVMSE